MTLDLFSLNLYTPLPDAGDAYTYDINPLVTSIHTTTTLPGGYNTLDIGLVNAADRGYDYWPSILREPIEYRPLGHTVLTAGAFTLFEGRLLRPSIIGGHVVGFSATGYGVHGLKDAPFVSTNATTMSSGEVVKLALRFAAPAINLSASTIGESGISYTPASQTQRQPAQIIDEFSKAGAVGSSAIVSPMDWAVWEQQRATWLRRTVPEQAQYLIEEGPNVKREPDYTDLYTTVIVKYGDGLYTDPITNDDARVKYGINRTTVIDAGTISLTQAQGHARSQLAQLSQPKTAISVQLTGSGPLLPGGSVSAPAETVRCGQWVSFGADDDLHLIVGTELTIVPVGEGAVSMTLDLHIDNFPRNLQFDFGELERVAGHVAANTSPNSGAAR